MTEQQTKNSKGYMAAALNHIYINEIIFISLILLCFFGEILMEVSDRAGVFYWLLMSPVFFFSSMLSEKTKALATGFEAQNLIKNLLLLWGSAFFAILLVFLTWHAEMMKALAAAITIHIILAHTMFLSGIVLGFRYYLIGTLLFMTAGLTTLMEAHFAIDLLITLPFIWLGLYWEKKHVFPNLTPDNEIINEIVEDQDHHRRKDDIK